MKVLHICGRNMALCLIPLASIEEPSQEISTSQAISLSHC